MQSYVQSLRAEAEEDGLNRSVPFSTPVTEFLRESNVFITGATGFLGRVLIEKLLRISPDLENIFVLVRPKKGKDVTSRLDEIFDDPLYKNLMQKYPKCRHKINVVYGDCSQPDLGISLADRTLLMQKVDLVFHAAATVRFDEKLRTAMAINVTATKDMLTLCKQMPKLKAVVHVSTAYCNCPMPEIDEKFYDPPMAYERIIAMIEACTDEMLDKITPQILGKWPNSYAMTKAVAEDVVRKEKGDLPIVVFRPAIVIATSEEPLPGWIDNLYGPTGVVVGAGTGVLKSLHCEATSIAEVVPVDMVVNSMIASAWDIYHQTRNDPNKSAGEDPPIYNYVSSCEKPLRWFEFANLIEKHGIKVPSLIAIWYYCLTLNRNYYVHRLYTIFLHFLPALFVDGVLRLQGKPPRLTKIYQKLDKFSNVIAYFSTRTWKFHNNNTQALWHRLSAEDQTLFNFDMKTLDWDNYFYYYIRGCRAFLAKEDMSTLPEAKIRWRRFYWMHQTVKLAFLLVCLRLAWALLSTAYGLISTTDTS